MKGDKIQINDPELVEELLKREVDFSVWKKIGVLNALANCKTSFEQAARLFDMPHSTAYEWIRKWNKDGYDGLLFKHNSERGRPSKLSDENVRCMEELLKEKDYWQTSEVVELIAERFGVRLSHHQVRRILRGKLRMNFSKPYPKDYIRPDNAEELLGKQLELSSKYLMEAKGYWFEEIALGFADESAPQLTANTVRVWSFGKPEMKKNTQKMKANTVGFYALRGTSVREFAADSKTESFVGFLILYSQGQESARGSRRHGDISDVSAAIFPRSQSNRVYLEEHKEGRFCKFCKTSG